MLRVRSFPPSSANFAQPMNQFKRKSLTLNSRLIFYTKRKRGSALALTNWTSDLRPLAILGRANLPSTRHGFDIPANIQSEFLDSNLYGLRFYQDS